MIIDFHTHIFPDGVLEERGKYLADRGFHLLYSSAKSRMTGCAGLMDYIRNNDLRGAVAMSFPWESADLCRNHNEYMYSSLASSDGRVFPFGMVPRGDTGSVRRIAREIKSAGLCGIGEIAFYDTGLDAGGERFLREVFEAAADLSLPVCLHLNEPVGHHYQGKYEPSLSAVYPLLAEYSSCRVILSHWGGGMIFYELMPEVREALVNVWYDTAASPFIYGSAVYRAALGMVNPGKILFGSDYPLLGIKRYSSVIEAEAGESAPLILGLNAKNFLGIKD